MKWVVTGFLLLFFSILSLFIGVSDLSIMDIFSLTEKESDVLFISRLPRLISLLIAGMSMSIAGLIMQQLSQNKFVSPTTAGTMDSARLGILVSMLLFPAATMMQKMLISFLFALAGTFIFMKILDKIKYRDAIFIPLVGLMFGNIVGSATTFLAYRYDLVQSVGTWLHGDFSMLIAGRYELLYLSVPVVVIAYIFAHHFTIAGMGEDFAANLGLSYQKVVYLGLGLVALITASVVLTAGILPFLGLIVPNIVTIYQGDHLKSSILGTAMLGALFVLVCDILGRVLIYPYEISIGLTVGVLGSGIFLYLLLRRRSYGF